MSNETLLQLLSFVDYTTLSGEDTRERVTHLCQKALALKTQYPQGGYPAAICVYPPFAALVRKLLGTSGIRTACVAGAFPSGQSPLEIKVQEVRWSIEHGAQEIDTLLNRGLLLEGRHEEALAELQAIRRACKGATLKVILETGALESTQQIAQATQMAIKAGADFVKTSTGKTSPAATLEAVEVMAREVAAHHKATGRKVGIKPAGGITTASEAQAYMELIRTLLGEEWLTPQLFRIGASRLVANLLQALSQN
ncbi:MAG: deoxyribose-phosphate aldolase [Bacteroidetes bacterium]|nr:MAG: deoxyribose-phosphate aldolase [Bacteroidota bacterium]